MTSTQACKCLLLASCAFSFNLSSSTSTTIIPGFKKSSPKDMLFIAFRQRGKRGRKRNIARLPTAPALAETQSQDPPVCGWPPANWSTPARAVIPALKMEKTNPWGHKAAQRHPIRQSQEVHLQPSESQAHAFNPPSPALPLLLAVYFRLVFVFFHTRTE